MSGPRGPFAARGVVGDAIRRSYLEERCTAWYGGVLLCVKRRKVSQLINCRAYDIDDDGDVDLKDRAVLERAWSLER